MVSTFQIKTDTKWLVQIARYLDRASFRLTTACFYEGGPIRDQLEALGVRTYNLKVPDERDPRAIIRARRLIDKVGCEIVHTHLLRADLYGGAAARWAGVPGIVSTAYALGQYRRARRRRSDRLLDVSSAMMPAHVVAVSQAVRQDCIERLHMEPGRVTVIHTGIDPPGAMESARVAALRAEWGVGAEAPLVVMVARLSYEKGVDALIDAAATLRRTHPHLRVVVVGEGADRAELETRSRDLGLGGVVTFAGFLEDVWTALAAADVVCLPSKSEGMPNALLEAMAIGRPTVATAVGGVPEAIVSEENGLLVEPDRPRQLAEAIARLIDDRALARRLGDAGRRTVEERFLARDVVARYGEFYRGLPSERGRKRVGVAAAS
jgi:glycosyltransferase involved in cell wall biosynthesis